VCCEVLCVRLAGLMIDVDGKIHSHPAERRADDEGSTGDGQTNRIKFILHLAALVTDRRIG
jgi:hypothetical protein